MARSTQGIHSVLSNPRAYQLFQVAVGQPRRQSRFVQEHLRPDPGMRVLDVGCGPGDMLRLMPETHYLGLDSDPGYIEAARRRFGDRGEFRCADVIRADLDGRMFDAVIAHGLLHHLDDDGVDHLMDLTSQVLDPGGRLLTADPVHVNESSRFARWFVRLDRGENVRSPEGYMELGRRHFESVEISVERERINPPLLRWRHPIAVMACSKPR
jgi:cyclopropane fatty-acyl-phospholipid synthase-like methyltransferase